VKWKQIDEQARLSNLFHFSLMLLVRRSLKSALMNWHVCVVCTSANNVPLIMLATYSITEHRVPELIPVLGSQPAGDVSHKPSGRLPLLSARPAVTLATLKGAATSFAAW